jgi:predicted ATPase
MAIQQLTVHGYRSFRDIRWKPGRLNLLVGPNGSGKSNLLRLLELIAETAKGRLANALKPPQGGGIIPLLWDYKAPSLDWTIRIDPVDAGRDTTRDALTLELRLEHLPTTSSYRIAVDSLGNWVKYDQGLEQSPLWIYRRDPRQAVVYHQGQSRLVRLEDVDANESLLPQISDPSMNPIPTQTRRFLEGWRVYHDVHVERGAPMRLPATTQIVKLVEADGSNLVSVLHTLYTSNRDFKRQINEGMRAGFGNQFEELVFQPAAAQQIQLAIQWRSSSEPHTGQDLSDGTLRFLFLLTVLASPDPATLIAIDEPEVGLHPSMLPIIAEYAADAARRTQVVMTSHSPVFLDAFSSVGPQVTLLHREDGQTCLFPLPPEPMEKWLAEYRLGELFTSGDLEALAGQPVEAVPDFAERIKSLPPEDVGISATDERPRRPRRRRPPL